MGRVAIVTGASRGIGRATAIRLARDLRAAENAWNSRNSARVALAYTPDSFCGSRAEFLNNREAIQAFLTLKWARALRNRPKEFWTFVGNRITRYSHVLRQLTDVTASVRDELPGLMALAQEGDKQAYCRVLTACVPLAAAAARRAGVQGAAVDDVVRDVLLTVHRAMPTYEPSRPFGPWLQAIAHHRAMDALRSRGQRSAHETVEV